MPEPSDLPEEHAKDLELMLAVRDGDEAAFRALVERHQLPLVNFFARLGSGDAAEDLAQQTFLRLYKYRTRYEPRARFTTFLYMMARQIRIDSLRKLQRVKRLKEEFEEEQFLRHFCVKLTGYALGREVLATDRALIDEMMANLRKWNGSFAAAIKPLVLSRQFRNRRNP